MLFHSLYEVSIGQWDSFLKNDIRGTCLNGRDKKISGEGGEVTVDDAMSKATLICFSDASFANLKYSGSQGGLLVFLEGSDRRYMILACQSQKLNRVVKSTLTAENLVSQEAVAIAYEKKVFY